MKIKNLVLLIISPCTVFAAKGTLEGRLDALEYSVGVPLTGADIEDEDYKSPEMYVMERFDMTEKELLSDIILLSQRYTPTETNEEKRVVRNAAIRLMGYYCTTNQLAYLSTIWKNHSDYSQRDALKVAMAVAKTSNQMWDIVNDVFSCSNNYTQVSKFAVYSSLSTFSKAVATNSFLEARNERIAAFFLKYAAVETNKTLYVDQVACDLNPSYRHSQQRRDNLARLRKPGLTGLPAQLYDAAQRDAQPKE